MDKFNFNQLIAPLQYFQTKLGRAEVVVSKSGNSFKLLCDGFQWMTYNRDTNSEAKQFFIEVNLAKGKIVTTGLGFGVIQTLLALKNNVSEIVVFEKHKEIIDMFKIFVTASKFNTDKIKFVNSDASEAINENCDWLLMDHFEVKHQPIWEIVSNVRELSSQSKANNVLFWPMPIVFNDFCKCKNLLVNQQSYLLFRDTIKIDKLPYHIDTWMFDDIQKINSYGKI